MLYLAGAVGVAVVARSLRDASRPVLCGRQLHVLFCCATTLWLWLRLLTRACLFRFRRAYVVPGTKDLTSEQIMQWVDGKVSNHKRLRGGVVLVDAVPKSAAGKILRKVLRDQARKANDKVSAKL